MKYGYAKMKVLHICYEYPPLGGGGGEACYNIVKLTSQKGVENTVLTSWYRNLPAVEKGDNFIIRRVFCFRRKIFQCSIFEMILYMVIALPFAVCLQIKEKFDLVHVHFAVPCGPIGYVLRILFGVNYIMTIQGGDVPSFIPEQTQTSFKMVKPLTVPIWRQAKGRYAVSNSLAEMAMEDYKDVKVDVIYNGVDDDFFQNNKKEYGERISILFAGRLSVQKRVDIFLRALAEIKDVSSWDAHIVGDGPLLSKLKTLAKQIGLTHRVIFYGWLKKEELKKILAGSHIFVLPSFREGLPLSGIQAMASGLAIIGSCVCGVRDIIVDGENGYLFNNGDYNKLAEDISMLLEDRKLLQKMGESAKDKAAVYHWQYIAQKYMEIYNSLSRN